MNPDGLFFKDLACVEGFEDEDMIEMSFTDENGVTQLRDFVYFTEDTMGEAGWYNEDYEIINDTEPLALGQGMWFCSASGSPKQIQTAGQVSKSNPTHAFVEPSTLTASAFPVAFCPNGENVTWVGMNDEDMIEVAFTDEESVTQLRDYIYFTEDTMGEEGWYNEDYELVEADQAIVGAGEGFWLCFADTTDGTFTEVSPVK